MKAVIVIVALVWASVCLAAPTQQYRWDEDPELTAGYYQGDIVLDRNRNGLRNKTLHWPNGIVYYKINEGFFDAQQKAHILYGMRIIEGVSCIRFKEVTGEQPYYVNITGFSDGCYSEVGWLNEVQAYNLAPYPLDQGCFRLGTIKHELLHTLGFYHMQSASNRDEYVRIAEENILPNTLHNFEKYNDTILDDYDQEYDYGSVLHYSAYAFSANGEMTIVPLKGPEASGIMGQRRHMSKSDINRLNVMYKCTVKY